MLRAASFSPLLGPMKKKCNESLRGAAFDVSRCPRLIRGGFSHHAVSRGATGRTGQPDASRRPFLCSGHHDQCRSGQLGCLGRFGGADWDWGPLYGEIRGATGTQQDELVFS